MTEKKPDTTDTTAEDITVLRGNSGSGTGQASVTPRILKQRFILDEKLGSDPQGLPIERVEQSMSRPIRSCARAWNRILAEFTHMATEWPLIDFPIFSA